MRITVKEVAEAKGIKNATQLAEIAHIPLASMYRIWNGTAKMIGMDTLEKLCTALKVPVGMLVQHIPEEDIALRAGLQLSESTISKKGTKKGNPK